MLLTTLVASALASEPAEPLPTLDRPVLADREYAKNKGGNKKKGKKKKPHWETEPYLQPGGGVRIYNDGSSSTSVASLGGEAGVDYAYVNAGTPEWGGRTRVLAQFVAADGGTGRDLRLGAFIGPHWKYVGIETGPDLRYDEWSYGGLDLDPTFGVELPVTATFNYKKVEGYAGVATAWLQEESRRVDWSKQDVPGVGHEFAYLAGVGGRIAGVLVGAQGEYRITAGGPTQSFLLTAQVDGATLQDIVDMVGETDTTGEDGNETGGTKKK